MTKRMKAFRILTALVFVVVALASLTPQPILALSSSIIIAEVYGGGSAAGSSLPDYLVLFNMSSEAQSMNNWKLYGIQGSGLGMIIRRYHFRNHRSKRSFSDPAD